ncbi:MAG: hypothetical protein AAF432_11745 [Planctomycetota bacterium]
MRHVSSLCTAGLMSTALILMPGCLVVSGKSIDESGTQVTSSTLDQIETGVTSEAWLRATLGAPAVETVVEDQPDVRVLRYDHTVEKSEGGAVFLLFAGGSDIRRTTRTYFEIDHGVVSRYWIERARD